MVIKQTKSGSSSSVNSSAEFKAPLLENISNNCILLELEQDGFNTPDEKAEELIKNIPKLKYLFALKLLFENPFNQFSDEVLRNSLVTLADPTPFDYYGKQSVVRLELHIRTWVAVLEKICFTSMRLSKKLRDKVYNSLAKFAEIHKKTTQVMQEGIDNNYRSDFNQFNQLQDNKEDEGIINKRNYNIDFLLIHLRDTLHSLRDDETWFQEIIRRTKKLFKTLLSLALQEANSVSPNEIGSILTQLREGEIKTQKLPKCRENIEDNDIRYLPQNVIYNHLRSQFFKAGHILPLIKSEELSCDSDSGDSEVDNPILVKKKKILEAVKSNPNISFQSIFQIGNSKKQHPKYQNAMKELEEKNYKNAEHLCKEFLKTFPESYSMRCILAYTYLCLDDYEQAFLYLNQAIKLKEKRSIAWSIRGEIHFGQGNYYDAIRDLKSSIKYKTKINNIYIVLGINYCNINCDEDAIKNFKIALKKDSKNSLCLKYCAYIYEKQGKYSDTLMVLNKLLSVNKKDSLILCFYGEILSRMEKYDEAAIYFIKANNIDPENVHNLTKRAIAYYNLQEYDKASLDFNKVIQLDISNILAYYYKGLIYYRMGDIDSSITTFKKCIELDPNNDLEKMYFKKSRDYLSQISTVDFNLKCLPNYHKLITKINQFTNIYHDKSLLIMRCYCVNDFNDLIGFKEFINMYMFKEHYVYFASNLYNLKNYHQFHFQESNIIRLPRLYSRDIEFCSHHSTIPITPITFDIVWRINVKKINSPDVFINFMIESNTIFYKTKEYKLEYTDLLNLEGLGWIEYVTFISINWPYSEWIQFSIETKKESIDMEIDYVRLIRSTVGNNHENRIYFPKMNHLLLDNVPEALEDK
ncbi:TPR-like protein [Rhizophagus irregularis]|uniref:TPR-like protein n=1 Tax=Rhizophagus irregularis TaxID=588596 RepID=A0A2N0PTI4_9GLOM|nr:TPR-like protein [Rhizophagus irregularis]